MRNVSVLCSLVGVSVPLLAAAQPPPPPPASGQYSSAPAVEPKMRFDIGLLMGLPQGDLEDTNVDSSPGVHLQFGYTVAPNISLLAGLRYFAVQADGEDTDVSSSDLELGGRYAFPVSPTAKVFGEAMLLFSQVAVDDGADDQSESGIGFGVRGGAQFLVSGNISVGGSLSYTTSEIEFEGGFDLEVAWLGLEGFVSFGF